MEENLTESAEKVSDETDEKMDKYYDSLGIRYEK